MSKKKLVVDTTTGEIMENSPKYYVTVRDYHLRASIAEKNNGLSQTIPNEAFTLREILARFAAGLPVTGMKVPMYHGDSEVMMDIDNWKKMDLSEQRDYLERVKQRKRDLENQIKAEADKKIKARRDAEFQAAVQNELKRQAAEKEAGKPA